MRSINLVFPMVLGMTVVGCGELPPGSAPATASDTTVSQTNTNTGEGSNSTSGGTSSTSGGTNPTSGNTTPTWSGQIKALLQTHCGACHGPGGPDVPFFDISTQMSVKNSASDMLSQVQSGAMPQFPGGVALSPADMAALQAWVAAGEP